MKSILINLCAFVVLVGCRTAPPLLIDADIHRIFAIAQRELESKCLDFNTAEFLPQKIVWYSWGQNRDSYIHVTFYSKRVDRVTEWSTKSADGIIRRVYDHKTATVCLSNQGTLVEQNRGEWLDFPEMKKVWYSESSVLTTDEDYLSKGGFETGHAVYTNMPPSEPTQTLEEQYAKRKLRTVIVPEVNFRSTRPYEAIQTLWKHLPHPLKQTGHSDVSVLDAESADLPSVSFAAREISLYDALYIVCQLSGLELYYEGFVPHVRPTTNVPTNSWNIFQ